MISKIDWNNLQPLTIPGFSEQERKFGRGVVPCPPGITVEEWYAQFVSKIRDSLQSGGYFPVFRASDGEFTFVLGRSFSDLSLQSQISERMRHMISTLRFASPFYSSGRKGYCETYPFWQLPALRRQFAAELKVIATHGCLCLNFSESPLSRSYRHRFVTWINDHDIELSPSNYYHFYFVYGLLLGPQRFDLFSKKRIAVFTSDIDGRSRKIVASLEKLGVADVFFYETSTNHPMHEKLRLQDLRIKPDICLVGAGVGAANILVQLQALQCLCIDAGFVIDILGDDSLRGIRPYTVPDTGSR